MIYIFKNSKITLDENNLAFLEADTDFFNKDYILVIWGSFNDWDFCDEWNELSDRDIRLAETNDKLTIDLMTIKGKARGKRYLVLYMQDGHNVFMANAGATYSTWEVDRVVSDLLKEGKMQEIIIVAIHNTPRRSDEYAGHLPSQYAELVCDIKTIY